MGIFNFKQLEDYPTTLDTFDGNMGEMVNNIYVGPQGELLENIGRFNSTYNTNIDVTKQFTFKPGCYDKIKQAYTNHVLRWDMRPRGASSIFKRITDYGWRLPDFRSNVLRIEEQMSALRNTGIRWQDNTDMLLSEIQRFKDIVNQAIEISRELYPFLEISVKMVPDQHGRPSHRENRRYSYLDRQGFTILPSADLSEIRDYKLIFLIKLNNPAMNIHLLTDDGIKHCEIPMGDIMVASGTYFLPLISRNWDRSTRREDSPGRNMYTYFLDSIYLTDMGFGLHPYIRSTFDRYTWNILAEDYKGETMPNICMGNMANNIRDTLINSQIEAHITYIVTWLTNYYIPQTNPLNRIRHLKAGSNKIFFNWNKENANSAVDPGMSNWEDCSAGERIYFAIYNHGRAREREGYRMYRFSVDSSMFISRKTEYIQNINAADLPCNECSFLPKCGHVNNIFLLLQDNAFTPMEEAYIGFFVEYAQHCKVMSDEGDARKQIYFVEELILYCYVSTPEVFNEKIIEANICIRKWAETSEPSELVNLSWDNTQFKRRYRELMIKIDSDREGLVAEALNESSTFVWTVDNVREYRASKPEIAPDEIFDEINKAAAELEFDEINEAFNIASPEEIARAAELEEISTLTPEQATLRWATQQGGANNL